MTDRRTKIVEAASQLFLRYGYQRTTFSDIAKAAEISRPVLYANFSDKEKVLGAVIERYNLDVIAQIQAAWVGADNLEEKLFVFCEIAVLGLFDLTAQWPDAEAVIASENQVAADAYHAGVERFIALVEHEFMSYRASIEAHGQTVSGYARFFVTAALKLKKNVLERAELEMNLGALRASVFAVLGQ